MLEPCTPGLFGGLFALGQMVGFPEKLVGARSSLKILARTEGALAVDKPVGLEAQECLSADAGKAGAAQLCSHLASAGLGRWVPMVSLKARVSGACWLSAAGSATAARAATGKMSQTVVLGVENCSLAQSGRLGSHQYRIRERFEGRALVAVETRANVEDLLDELLRAGLKIVGGGLGVAGETFSHNSASRTFLHVERVSWSGKPEIFAPVPEGFRAWLKAGAQRTPDNFRSALVAAAVTRLGVCEQREAFRLLGEGSGELSGVTVDCYGPYAVLAVSSQAALDRVGEMADCLVQFGARGVYVKQRVRKDLRKVQAGELSSESPVRGERAPAAFPVQMGEVRLWARLEQGHSTGIFLDQAANWSRVASWARNGSLLNLFCYTGAFTVFAAKAGVASSVSVDLSGRALDQLRENLELNGLSGGHHRVLKADAIRWLARACKRDEQYDVIVLDPPSFGTRSKGVLSLQRDYQGLLAQCLALLAPEGRLLSVVHHRGLLITEMAERAQAAAGQIGIAVQSRPLMGDWDCPTVPGVTETKNLVIRRLS